MLELIVLLFGRFSKFSKAKYLKRKDGKSLVEILVGLALLTILGSVIIPEINRYYRAFKFQQRLFEIESTLKWARLVAIERGINVGICVTDSEPNSLLIYDMEQRRSLICTGTLLKRVKIEEGFISLNASGGGSAFDPRGLAIFSTTITLKRTDGNACVEYTLAPLRGFIWRKECQR